MQTFDNQYLIRLLHLNQKILMSKTEALNIQMSIDQKNFLMLIGMCHGMSEQRLNSIDTLVFSVLIDRRL